MSIVLEPDVYDALEFVAYPNGGIGKGRYANEKGEPVCIYGCAFAGHEAGQGHLNPLRNALVDHISATMSDEAVVAINRRRGRPLSRRVPFADWCKELNVVRGGS